MKITNELIKEYKDNGLITVRPHEDYPELVILNYTPIAAYGKNWDDFLIRCRGLIFNTETETVLANPFKKFFNYGETPETLEDHGDEFEAMEKMDGSLGIAYAYDDKIMWATRGSFHSPQAQMAQKIWNEKYSKRTIMEYQMVQSITLLAEIIYPENRIVVDYGDMEDLVVLGMILNEEDGKDLNYSEMTRIASYWKMPMAKVYNLTFEEMLQNQKTLSANDEGYVIRFPDGFRMKIKGEEYVRVHRIVFDLSDKNLAQGWKDDDIIAVLASIPEEFRIDFEAKVKVLYNIYENTLARFDNLLKDHVANERTNKDLGLNQDIEPEFKNVLFTALNNRGNEQVFEQLKDIAIKTFLSSSHK